MQIRLKFLEADRDKTVLERDKKERWCYVIHSVRLWRGKNISKVFNKDTWFYFFHFKGCPEQRNSQWPSQRKKQNQTQTLKKPSSLQAYLENAVAAFEPPEGPSLIN